MEIKELRKKLGLTQQSLAVKLGVALRTVANWEQDHARPSPLALRELQRLLEESQKQTK